MSIDEAAYRTISPDNFLAGLQGEREFADVLFSSEGMFDEMDLANCQFTRCAFRLTIVRNADFSEAVFKDCKFAPARFAGCRFVEVRLENCGLFDAAEKKGCTFAFCEMRGAELVRCNFSAGAFERSNLYNIQATECIFRGVRFHGCDFSRTISKTVALTKARFDGCNFGFADLSGLSLRGCELPGCKFSETALFDVDLTDAMMTGCILDRAEWDRATLRGADLRGATISGLNLVLLADYAGLMIDQSQQEALLTELGLKVWPG